MKSNMSRAESIILQLEAERVKFEHPKSYFGDESIPLNKRAEVWVEELFKLASSVLGKKATEWATEQMVKYYGKLQRDFQTLVDKELRMMPF